VPEATAGSAPLLEMRRVSKRFPGVQALQDVGLTLHAGEILALLGENGAGKSTLIKILSGAQSPDAGQILINGSLVHIQSPAQAEALGVATVYQEFNLFPDLTVAENLLFPHHPKRGGAIDWGQMRREARALLNRLGTHIPVNRLVKDLSVAERQMVEIAKALHRKVRILVLDEPTAVLGGTDVDRLFGIVRSLAEQGVGVIFISHRLHEIFGFVKSYTVLKDGRHAGSGDIQDIDHDGLVALMVGRELARDTTAAEGRSLGEELLRVEGISRKGSFRDVSFSVRAGEIVGIAGLRGAGRTEVVNAIFGAQPIDSGKVVVRGRATAVRSPVAAMRQGIGLVPEERGTQGLVPSLSAPPNISLPRLAKNGEVKALPGAEKRTASRYIRLLNMRVPRLENPTSTLSGGNQQKVVLAKWLEAGVSILILDEPTRGIDVGSKQEVYEIIRSLCRNGIGVLMVSSELPELLENCDRIVVMHEGQAVATLDGAAATEELVMAHAVGGGPRGGK